MAPATPPKHRRRRLRGCLLGCGLAGLLLAGGVVWLGVKLAPPSGSPELTAYHPFRSPAARERYLAHYDERAKLWPLPVDERFVETSWGTTFVRVSGPEDAPPLVLLPGANTTSLMWVPNIEALAASYRTYAVDNIYDFGRSVYTRRVSSGGDFVAWLDELCDELGLGDEIRLMGLSYGGWITGQYALRHPRRVARAVMLAPAATVLPLSGEFLKYAVPAIVPHRYFTARMLRWIAADTIASGPEGRALIERATDDVYLALRSFEFKPLVNPTVLADAEWAGLAPPALFVVGENEVLYPAAEAVARLARVAPQVETAILPGAGHDLTIAQPARLHRVVLEFLADPPAADAAPPPP